MLGYVFHRDRVTREIALYDCANGLREDILIRARRCVCVRVCVTVAGYVMIEIFTV